MFSFTEDQLMLKELVEQFAEKEVAAQAATMDENSTFPAELFQQMAEMGLTGLCIPEEYGGAGGKAIEKVIAVEALAKKCASTAATLSIHMVCPAIIMAQGTEEQKAKYLPKLASGALGAFALTEAGAGSDASAVRTTAVLDEATGEYVLNGSKCFITGGARADYVLLVALTDPALKTRGMSCFIIEKGTPGFTYGKIEKKMGLHGSETAELVLDNVRVPKENVVGALGKGFRYAMEALDEARIGVAAQALGIAEGAIDASIKYSKERVQFGKPINALQGIQWYLADMATKTEAAKWLTFYAADLHDKGLPFTKEAAMAKLNASENARFVTNLALQIHGGYGYMSDYPIERMYRDAKITEIYEGTSEIHKVVISRALIG